MVEPFVLALDQGTTSTRAVVFDAQGRNCGSASRELKQYYPRPGWVEHDADQIWQDALAVIPAALTAAGISGKQLACLGLTNQRETAILWDRASSQVLGRAIVWQDRRTTDFCRDRTSEEPWIYSTTGLVIDPYFSATKFRWMLEQDAALRRRAEAGTLAAGTVDAFLIWRLTGGKVHATDRSNASRTQLVNLRTADWDDELCRFFEVPRAMLPQVRPSTGPIGVTQGLDCLPDGLPILGVAGDQQAALFGQCAFAPGEAKCTYGTGAFFLQHLGSDPTPSRHRLLTTIAASGEGPTQYALEGAVFVAGAAVQWLRDGLKLFASAPAIEGLAARSDPEQPVLFVPGFVGLGAPHWVPEARGVLFGLTRGTSAEDVSRATLEGVAFQVADLIDAATADAGRRLDVLRVDGGMAANAWFLQCQADLLGLPVIRSATAEATSLGAAYLAGLGAGIWPNLETLRTLGGAERTFHPLLPSETRERRTRQWQRAVRSVIDFYRED
ncbi:MAG: glycerol kinase GlpK [Gemmataceae bacterium]